jgi:hypothetical protein
MLSYSQWAFNQLFVGGMCFTRELLEIYLHTLVPIKNTCTQVPTKARRAVLVLRKLVLELPAFGSESLFPSSFRCSSLVQEILLVFQKWIINKNTFT